MATVIHGKRTHQREMQPLGDLLESAARSAFAEHVRLYDEADNPTVVDVELHQFFFVYLDVSTSRSSRAATLIQCRVDIGYRLPKLSDGKDWAARW
jgi:hypothetical protein